MSTAPACPPVVRLRSHALAASVNGMAARLAREGHARASFIGKVSHELRTPLTVIKGYVYTLRRAEDDPVKAGRLDVINGECERLAYLVEDLLELSRRAGRRAARLGRDVPAARLRRGGR